MRNINVFGSDQGIFEESSTKSHPLGTRMNLGGGNTYHYAKASEALTQGQLVSWLVSSVAIAATKFDITAIGERIVDADATVAAGLCDDGFLVITDGTAAMDSYEVVTNTAGTAGTTDTLITLRRPLVTALSESSVGILVASPFYVQIANAANPVAEMIVGGTELDVTSGYFFWLKTWGLFNVKAGTTAIDAGGPVCGAEDDTGSGESTDTTNAEMMPLQIGAAPAAIADGIGGVMMLQCVP
jgi:hypothetical protein